jgi:hypothetical protein
MDVTIGEYPDRYWKDQDSLRRTGRSYRAVLAAVLEASENDDSTIYMIFPSHQMATYQFRSLLVPILSCLHGVKFKTNHAILPNGSEIAFLSDNSTICGLNPATVFYDHAY